MSDSALVLSTGYMVMLIEFVGDDGKYLNWIAQNPTDFVHNTRTRDDPSLMNVHRSSCWTVSLVRGKPRGHLTERGYKKVCSDSIANLRTWAQSHDRQDGSVTKYCRWCHPNRK